MDESLCSICYDEMSVESIRYGYPQCYDVHKFCADCLIEMLKTDTRCPIDRTASSAIVYRSDGVLCELGHNIFREHALIASSPPNRCLSCLNDVAADAYLFWRRECPDSHRVCFTCLSHKAEYGCLIGHHRCQEKNKQSRALSARQSSGSSVAIIEVQGRFIGFIRDLEIILRAVAGKHDNQTMARVRELYERARRTCTYPTNICMNCLCEVAADAYLFWRREFLDSHRVCFTCLTNKAEYGCIIRYLRPLSASQSSGNSVAIEVQDRFVDFVGDLEQILAAVAGKHDNQTTARARELYERARRTCTYPTNMCTNCLCEVAADTYPFWRRGCPDSHRVCVACLTGSSSGECQCLISNDCWNKRESKSRPLFDSQSSGRMVAIEVQDRFVCFIGDLEKMLAAVAGKYDSQTMRRAKRLYRGATSTGTFPANVCMRCLHISRGPMFGLDSCFNRHSFCGHCFKRMCAGGHLCPIDGWGFDSFYAAIDGVAAYWMVEADLRGILSVGRKRRPGAAQRERNRAGHYSHTRMG